MSQTKCSQSEQRMLTELIAVACSVADEAGAKEDFLRRLVAETSGKKMEKTAQAQLGALLGGGALASLGLSAAPQVIPTLIFSLLAAGYAVEDINMYVRRLADPTYGKPWFLRGEEDPLKDPTWKEPSGVHNHQLPFTWDVPNKHASPEMDLAREEDERYLRDRVRYPEGFGTSGMSSAEVRQTIGDRPDLGVGGAFPNDDPWDQIAKKRLSRQSTADKARIVTARYDSSVINAPDNPFLSFALPSSPEQMMAVLGPYGIAQPVTMRDPRFMPQGGEGYSPDEAIKWYPGGSRLESRMNRLRAFSRPEVVSKSLTAYFTNFAADLMQLERSGKMPPAVAKAVLERQVLDVIASGVPARVAWEAYDNAMDRLSAGGSGYLSRMMDNPADLADVTPDFRDDNLYNPYTNPGSAEPLEWIKSKRSEMEDIAGPMGQNIKSLYPQEQKQEI